MQPRLIVFLSIIFLVSFLQVLKMIVKHQLREVYAVVWTVVVFMIPVFILLFPLLTSLSKTLGFRAPINLMILIAFIVLAFLSLHFSALNSGVGRNLKNAIQKIAILETEIKRLNDEIESMKAKQTIKSGEVLNQVIRTNQVTDAET